MYCTMFRQQNSMSITCMVCDGVATPWDVDGDISDMKGPLSSDGVATSWGVDGDMNDIATNNADKYVLVKPHHE